MHKSIWAYFVGGVGAVQQVCQQHRQAAGVHVQHSGHSVKGCISPEGAGVRAQRLHHAGQPGVTPGLPAVWACTCTALSQGFSSYQAGCQECQE